VAVSDVYIKVFNDRMYAENGVVLHFGDGRPCWIIDPGLPPEPEQMIRYIREHELTPAAIVMTHAHSDHMAGIDSVRDALGQIDLYLAREEWPMLTDPMQNLSGQFGANITARTDALHDLPHGSELQLDGTRWRVFDTSGHSPGGRTIYCAELKLAFVGDAVFAGSIGRTDFHHSNHENLLANIRENILTLPDDTQLICGHGPATTVGAERTSNPFLQNV